MNSIIEHQLDNPVAPECRSVLVLNDAGRLIRCSAKELTEVLRARRDVALSLLSSRRRSHAHCIDGIGYATGTNQGPSQAYLDSINRTQLALGYKRRVAE